MAHAHSSLPQPPAPPASRVARRIHQQYQQAQIETASPTQLVVMLYDGAIRFGTLGLEAMREGNLNAQHHNLLCIQRIVSELMGSLNREAGGPIADNLFRLYVHMLEQLVDANLYDKPAPVEHVLTLLRDLRESWQEIERQATRGTNEMKAETATNTKSTLEARPPKAALRLDQRPCLTKPLAQPDALRPLLRLRQLAIEIEAAQTRGDVGVVCQAASLLAPAFADWKRRHAGLPMEAGEAASLALETRQLLRRCETSLMQELNRLGRELGRVRQGRRALSRTRTRQPTSGRRLDSRR